MDNFTISDQYGEYSTLRGEDGKPVVLGRGGFGITICAFKLRRLGDVEIRDEFALKILRHGATEDSKRRSRILKEILALRDLQHPNLASYKDCGEDEGCLFLVMELCRGGDLAALAARVGALPERFALQLILQVCAGLDEAHRKGYFHRDLKPTNILISEELPPDAGLPWLEDRLAAGHLRFKVVDFGLAGRFESEAKGGGFMGSPMFASPEQVREQRLDSRSDIYSLGMTLWYLATGKGPLLNASGLPVADAREAMRCHTSSSQHDLAFPEHFTEGFRSLLGRMIRKAPDERFRSAQELADAIRRQIEAMPAPPAGMPAPPAAMPLPKAPLANVATWGTGTFAEYYHVIKQVGRRAIGTFYQARHKASGNTVGFTAWVAANSPNAASEKLIGQHLDRLKSATSDPLAPKVLTRIVDWLRTTDEWCVAEEWIEGEKLDRFASLRGRAIGLEDAARLLWPLAEACDFLNQQGFDRALLSVDEIRLLSPRAEPDGADWLAQPIDEWGDWTIRLSALSLPQELAGESTIQSSVESSTTSRFDGCDAGQLRLNKSFSRLLYRLVEGADAAVAADWDAQAFTAAGKLGAQSNALLRDYICGTYAGDPMVEILKRICTHEGIASIPGRADAIVAPTQPPTRVPTDPGEGPGSAPPSGGNTTYQPGSVPPSSGGSRSGPKGKPILDTHPANQVEVAQLIPGRPGWVRSPYSRREQNVAGPEWRENATIQCQATGRPFQLPGELPAFEAILIPERFDAVLTPYVDPPQEVSVPLGKWKPNAELVCATTGRPLRQPQQLPAAIATIIDDRPGTVRSPYGDQPEIEVKLESWKPGQLLTCPVSDQTFALSAVLPPLLAIPGDAPGSFISPYAPDRPFDLPPSQCLPNRKFECPWTDQPLGLPAVLPERWQFEGSVRQAEVPEARSPYFEMESEGWQPLDAADWQPGAIIRCRGTGRPFVLPATLPALKVKAGPNPFSVVSPFPPAETIRIPAKDWIAGAEASVSLNAGTQCLIALPAELPTPDRVEIAELDSVPQGRQPQARGSLGAIRSPFVDDGEWIEIPAQRWSSGTRVGCPATTRPFWLPKELPPLEARLGQDLGTVHSPYTDIVLKISPAVWVDGNSLPCPETKLRFVLPHRLPWLEGGVDASRPGWVESPFDLGSAYLVEYAEWKPGEVLECPTSGRKFALPQSLPEWVPEAELDEASPGMVRNPHGPGNWFKVPGADWEAGANVHCPETQMKLALPADLPALEAALVEGKPGYVQTPYTSQPEQVKIHPSKWQDGNLVECPITRRPLRLPGDLPPLSSALAPFRKFMLPTAAAVLLAAIGFLVTAWINHHKLEKLRAKFREEAKTEFTWIIPPSAIPVTQDPIISPPVVPPVPPPFVPPPKESLITWDGSNPFYEAVYSEISFDLNNPPPGIRKVSEHKKVTDQSVSLPPGEYTVSLVGRERTTEDRILTSNLKIGNESSQKIDLAKIAPPIPRYLIGLEVVSSLTQKFYAYGDRSSSDIGFAFPVSVSFNYSTPCLLVFKSDFKSGFLVEENDIVGPTALLLLDQMVLRMAKDDQEKHPGKALLREYSGYTENKDSLRSAIESLNIPEKNLFSSDPKTLLDRRNKMFTHARSIRASADARGLTRQKWVQKTDAGKEWDLNFNYDWIVQLKLGLEDKAWMKLTTAVSMREPSKADWENEIEPLSHSVKVNGQELPGLFRRQQFSVSRIDQHGKVRVAITFDVFNPYGFNESFLSKWSLWLEQKENGEYELNGEDDGTFKIFKLHQ